MEMKLDEIKEKERVKVAIGVCVCVPIEDDAQSLATAKLEIVYDETGLNLVKHGTQQTIENSPIQYAVQKNGKHTYDVTKAVKEMSSVTQSNPNELSPSSALLEHPEFSLL